MDNQSKKIHLGFKTLNILDFSWVGLGKVHWPTKHLSTNK